MEQFKKKYSNEEAYQKIQHYCAYQERCHREVNQKLFDWGFNSEERGNLVIKLMNDGFLNEERFARAFVRGKFRQNQWGKFKIRQGLKAKGISDNLIKLAFEEIDESIYENVLKELLNKKSKTIKEKNPHLLKQKLAAYAIGKGFEPELIWELLK